MHLFTELVLPSNQIDIAEAILVIIGEKFENYEAKSEADDEILVKI